MKTVTIQVPDTTDLNTIAVGTDATLTIGAVALQGPVQMKMEILDAAPALVPHSHDVSTSTSGPHP